MKKLLSQQKAFEKFPNPQKLVPHGGLFTVADGTGKIQP